jgi:hypothetical protein
MAFQRHQRHRMPRLLAVAAGLAIVAIGVSSVVLAPRPDRYAPTGPSRPVPPDPAAYVDISGMHADIGGDPAASSMSPVESTSPTATDGANGISFERPVAWARWQPNEHDPITDGPLIYLSTDPLLAACATAADTAPNPPDGQGRACDWPLTSLSSNGVFVSWVNTRLLEPLPSTGEVLPMSGASARLQIERPGSCGQIGGDETVSVLVPIGQPTPLSNLAVVACLRGPDVALAEAQLRAMLVSATVER